jgi:hypothetical protein
VNTDHFRHHPWAATFLNYVFCDVHADTFAHSAQNVKNNFPNISKNIFRLPLTLFVVCANIALSGRSLSDRRFDYQHAKGAYCTMKTFRCTKAQAAKNFLIELTGI